MSIDDWSAAEALALASLNAPAPVSFRRCEATPYLLAAWWTGGQAYVVVYDGKIQPSRGVSALAPFFASLGEARLRALDVDTLESVLQIFDANGPKSPHLGGPRPGDQFPDLAPALRDEGGVLSYVCHFMHVFVPLPRVPGPPGPPGPAMGSRAPNQPLYFERHSLQVFPVLPDLDWKLEERVERPMPPLRV